MDVEISNLDNELNKMCAIDVEREEKVTQIIESGINKCIYSINNQIDEISSNDQLNLEGPSDTSQSVEMKEEKIAVSPNEEFDVCLETSN